MLGEYWSGWPFCSAADLPNPEIEPRSPALQVDSLPAEAQRKPRNTGVGRVAFLQGIFPTQESNPCLPHCRWILYQLRHKGSPRILEWVAYPFSRGSSRPRNRTRVFSLQADSLPTKLPGKPNLWDSGFQTLLGFRILWEFSLLRSFVAFWWAISS